MKTVILHGRLRRFGESFELDVQTPSEAVRALSVQLKGFASMLRRGEYHVLRDRRSIGIAETDMTMGDCAELHIVPVTAGSKRSGVLKIILGVALLGVGFMAAGGFGAMNTYMALGAGMLFNGLGQMLSPTPEVETNEGAETAQSYMFSGATNVTQEGNIIPVVYGIFWCGSLVLSAGNDVEEVL